MNTRFRLWLVSCLLSTAFSLQAQLYDRIWLGGSLGVDSMPPNPSFEDMPFFKLMKFEPQGVVLDSVQLTMLFVDMGTSTAMCDRHGNLQFLSNGGAIAMADGRIMEGGTGFNEGSNLALEPFYLGDIPIYLDPGARFIYQFIPDGSNDSVYYMIHSLTNASSDSLPFTHHSTRLQISKIDMSRRQGRGEVVYKNRILDEDSERRSPTFVLIRHGNGRDWWVLLWRYDATVFKSLLLENDSVRMRVRTSFPPRDTQHMSYTELAATTGPPVPSPDGTTLVYQCRFDSLWLMAFDRCSGSLAILDTIYTGGFFGAYAFSPSGRFLYGFGIAEIAQWDLYAADIAASKVVIDSVNMIMYPGLAISMPSIHDDRVCQPRLGPDGKIYYLCRFTHAIIENPDEKCPDCNACLPWRLEEEPKSCMGEYVYLFTPWAPDYRMGPLAGSPCDTLSSLPYSPGQNDDFALHIYPSPSFGPVTIELSTSRPDTEVQIGIVDMLGRVLYEYTLPPGSYTHQMDLSDWAAGVYHVVLWHDKQIRASKSFVLVR